MGDVDELHSVTLTDFRGVLGLLWLTLAGFQAAIFD